MRVGSQVIGKPTNSRERSSDGGGEEGDFGGTGVGIRRWSECCIGYTVEVNLTLHRRGAGNYLSHGFVKMDGAQACYLYLAARVEEMPGRVR